MKALFVGSIRTALVGLALCVVGVGPKVWAATPPAATLIAPTGTIPPSQPTFRWSAEGATWYHLWISKNSTPYFTNWVNTNFWTPSSTLEVGNYQWWVQTWNADGYGPWSATGTFTVQAPSDEDALRAAVAAGGTYTFGCDGTITVSGPLVVSKDLVLDGAGHSVTISGGGSVGIFLVTTGVTLTANNLIIANGRATNGGAIFIDGGTVNLLNSMIVSNSAVDTASYSAHLEGRGGGVYNNFGTLNISNAVFLRNLARGVAKNLNGHSYPSDGLGGAVYNDGGIVTVTASRFEENTAQGSEGITGTIKSGFAGWGGAIYNAGGLKVSLSTFSGNRAVGGAGDNGNSIMFGAEGGVGGAGKGGAICNVGTCWAYGNNFLSNGASGGVGGLAAAEAYGGQGGAGGQGCGGGIYHGGNALTVTACTFASNYVNGAEGTPGADGTYGGSGMVGAGGNGGNGGDALGGGICAVNGTLSLTNSSFAYNLAQGGNGGAGGSYSSYAHSVSTGGNGGKGGSAFGGLYVGGATAMCVNNSLGWNSGSPGTGAAGGSGNGGNGTNGVNGSAAGGLGRTSGELALVNSLVAYSTPTNAFGTLVDLGHNISSDLSCGFATAGSQNNVDPKLRQLGDNGGPTRTLGLVAGSPAIDAADQSFAPAVDQRGVARPFGSASDIGAFEFVMNTTEVSVLDETSLRAAVNNGGTVTFGGSGAITLSSPLVVNNDVVLDAGAESVVIRGNGGVRVFEVRPGATLVLMHLTIANGYATNGGGIYNEGTLSMVDCVVSNNQAVGVAGIAGTNGVAGIDGLEPTAGSPGGNGSEGIASYGGAVLNTGTFDAVNTLFIGNFAQGGSGGNGGTGGRGGAFSIGQRCDDWRAGGAGGNGGTGGSGLGGAVYNAGVASLTRVEFTANQVRGGAGGNGGEKGLTPCVFVQSSELAGDAGVGGSSGGGAIYNLGMLYVNESTVAENDSIGGVGGIGAVGYDPAASKHGGLGGTAYGGGIENAGTNCLANVTVGLNKARGGNGGLGGVAEGYPETDRQRAGNGGDGVGGGLHNTGRIWVTNCTIWNNWGSGGLSTNFSSWAYGTNGNGFAATLNSTAGEVFLKNTILGNLGSTSNCVGSISDGGYNLSSDNSCVLTGTGSLNNIDPKLAPLANNGGFGRTFALLNGSPAIDAADQSLAPAVDQRGVARPFGAASDIGAFEFVMNTTEVSVLDETSLRAAVNNGGTVTFGGSGTITLSSPLVVNNDVVLNAGEESVVISGNGGVRVFEVRPGATLVLERLTIANGYATNGGGIYNEGTLSMVDCVVSNNQAVGVAGIAGTNGLAGLDGHGTSGTAGTPGGNGLNGTASYGGAIYNAGIFDAQRTLFVRNSAQGGAGGSGGNGGNGGSGYDDSGRCKGFNAGGNGGIAGNGGIGYGGALYNLAFASLSNVEFATNEVRGGVGGNGGTAGGTGCSGAQLAVAGEAGTGAASYGGAIYNAGTLTLSGSTVAQNNSVGGRGGMGGGSGGWQASGIKNGGAGGTGNGGGIVNVGTNFLVNVTVGLNGGTGGNGGLGGTYGGCPSEGLCNWPCGTAGDGIGGGLLNSGYVWGTNCTIWNNFTYGGISTNPNPYYNGTNGNGFAATLNSTGGEVILKDTILGNLGSTSNCVGLISDGGYNLCSDNSCAFTGTGSLNNMDPKLAPLANNGGFGRTFALVTGSPAVDASRGECPATDERGVPRPHGMWSDIGAYEAINLMMQKTYSGLQMSCFGWPNTYYTLQSSVGLPGNWVDVETVLTGRDGRAGFAVTPTTTETNVLFRIKFGQ